MTNRLLMAVLSAGLVYGATALPSRAEEASEHQGHHRAKAGADKTPAPTQQGKMEGGMMGGEKCKMMEEMHAKMGGGMKLKGDTGPSSQAYHGIMMRMHEEMAVTYTGNADVDFVKGMIPHHQAAVDMAKTALAFGKDPEVKKLAEKVIKAQETEITQMKAWLNDKK